MESGELIFAQRKIDDKHKDVLWYGGRIAEYHYKGYTFILGAYGDVYATLLDCDYKTEVASVRDKRNNGCFYDEMRSFIFDDLDLRFLKDTGRLVLENNNWFEILVDGPDGTQYDTGWVTASDDYEEAIKEMIENADDFIKEVSDKK